MKLPMSKKSRLEKSWQWVKDRTDGKKLWAAVIGAITLYGIPYCRSRWLFLPWDEVLIPLLAALGIIGAGHKIVKAKAKNEQSETDGTSEPRHYRD